MVLTYKQQFNKKYGQPQSQSNSIADIARLTGYKKLGFRQYLIKELGHIKQIQVVSALQ